MIPEKAAPAYLTDESMRRTRETLLIFQVALLLFPISLKPESQVLKPYDVFFPEIFRYGLR